MIVYQDFYYDETPSENAYFFLQRTDSGMSFVPEKAFLKSHFSQGIFLPLISSTFGILNSVSMERYVSTKLKSRNGTRASNPLQAIPLSALKQS